MGTPADPAQRLTWPDTWDLKGANKKPVSLSGGMPLLFLMI